MATVSSIVKKRGLQNSVKVHQTSLISFEKLVKRQIDVELGSTDSQSLKSAFEQMKNGMLALTRFVETLGIQR